MPAETDHPCFLPPKDKNVKIWRYMDFTKFVSLLETESLFLSRVDKFEDPYEGATSHANANMRPHIYGGRIFTVRKAYRRKRYNKCLNL